MWVITFQARCTSIQSERATMSSEQAACLVESALSVALLDLCGAVQVERVEIEDEASGANEVNEVNERAVAEAIVPVGHARA